MNIEEGQYWIHPKPDSLSRVCGIKINSICGIWMAVQIDRTDTGFDEPVNVRDHAVEYWIQDNKAVVRPDYPKQTCTKQRLKRE